MEIQWLKVHAKNATVLCDVHVITKRGTHYYIELNNNVWTMIFNTDKEYNVPLSNTMITSTMLDSSLIDELNIEGNSVCAIYIDTDTFLRYSMSSSTGMIFVVDS